MGRNQAVPVRWMAPEALRYTKFSIASDVWAYGVTIWEIYTLGEYPYFLQARNEDICQKVVNGLTLTIPENCPKSIKNVMASSWRYFPFERISFEDIVSIIVKAIEENENHHSGMPNEKFVCEMHNLTNASRTKPKCGSCHFDRASNDVFIVKF